MHEYVAKSGIYSMLWPHIFYVSLAGVGRWLVAVVVSRMCHCWCSSSTVGKSW